MPDHPFEEGDRYRALKTALGARPFSGPAGALTVSDVAKQIGVLLVAKAQRCFVDQGKDGKPWPERAVPNIYGIISDLSHGVKPPARRFQARPAGVDKGTLRSAIAFRLVGVDTVEVGVDGPAGAYADKINDGGKTESEVITSKVRQGLYAFLYGAGDGNAAAVRRELKKSNKQAGNRNFYGAVSLKQAKADMRASLGFLFNKKFLGKRLEGKIPPRPFLTLSENDTREIATAVGSIVTRVA